MATTLRPSYSYAQNRTIIPNLTSKRSLSGFGANAARRFERACHVLAQVIDISLAAVFLLGDVVLAALLVFMIAGQTFG